MSLTELLQWLESTSLGSIARESLYGFQILVGIHILGLIFSVGLLLWVDLRMLGHEMGSRSISGVYRALLPWFTAGFAVMFLSGAALFAGFATSAVENRYFWIKMGAIALAGINAALFHFVTGTLDDGWDTSQRPTAAIRLAGLSSLVLWTVVILCGRMISYTMY